MTQWPIVNFAATDKLILDGLLVEPNKRSNTAFVFLHGLSSVFYTNTPLLGQLTKLAQQKNAAFLSCNTRGAGVITRFRKIDKRRKKGYRSVQFGGAFERFADCIHDIGGALDFLKSRGYTKVVLIGHSTGANKAVYYQAKTHDERVVAVVLLAPGNDMGAFTVMLGDDFASAVHAAQQMVDSARGDELLSAELHVGWYSARRFLSLATSKSRENTFPYDNARASWHLLKKLCLPTLVTFGAEDEYLGDFTAAAVLAQFQKALAHNPHAVCSLIHNTGHGFVDAADRVAAVVDDFLSTKTKI